MDVTDSRLQTASVEGPSVDVCICSYGRPSILLTLEGLKAQKPSNVRIRIIVADNTEAGAMQAIVCEASRRWGLPIDYIHAPKDNISVARNACLAAARAEWIAFLDDDEVPEGNWLEALLNEVRRGNFDAVVGPVKAVYGPDAPRWAVVGDIHSVAPVFVAGEIRTAYTGNVIFRRALSENLGLKFRVNLGRCGGEDEDFFYRFVDGGGRIGFAADAIAHEKVARDRLSLAWVARRSFRAGQSHGLRLATRGARLSNVLLAAAKAIYCSGGFLVCAADEVRRAKFLWRAALHVGVVARLSGLTQIELYGAQALPASGNGTLPELDQRLTR